MTAHDAVFSHLYFGREAKLAIRGKDFRCELDQGLHEALRMMADHEAKPIQVLGAELLEEAIAGKLHSFKVMLGRLERSGILRNGAETRPTTSGSGRK